ncbi:MAG: glycosyltransferase [Oscillospiraceae bacterium]|nr:glycosyltransferase [Oscillospiraceae bacterium]
MKEIMVSVIMPCLNVKDFIEEAIESVLNQTLKDIELIIVDADSDDGTVEIIDKYRNQDDRIVFLHSDRKSMGYQYNIGIKKAKGKYIGFVESDDYIDTKMYEELVGTAEQNELDFVKSDFDVFIGDKNERFFLNYVVLSTADEDLYNNVINPADYSAIIYRDVSMWNGIYKRDFIEKNRIFLNETAGAAFQDIGFILKSFMKAERIMYVHIPSYHYRKDNLNASVYNKVKHIKFVMDEMRFITEFMNSEDICSPFRAVIFHRLFGSFCAYYDEYINSNQKIEETEKQLEEFFLFIKDCYKKLEYHEINKEKIDKILSLTALLRSVEDFKVVRENISYLNKKGRKDFFESIKNRDIVIFGAGEVGQSIYACLYRNNIKSILCFCDNDIKKQGTNIMGLPCVSLDKITESCYNSDICFIIANIAHYNDIIKQLIKNNTERKNIIKSTDILPLIAFEINIKEL